MRRAAVVAARAIVQWCCFGSSRPKTQTERRERGGESGRGGGRKRTGARRRSAKVEGREERGGKRWGGGRRGGEVDRLSSAVFALERVWKRVQGCSQCCK